MQKPVANPDYASLLGIRLHGVHDRRCRLALDQSLNLLAKRLPSGIKLLINGTEITIANDLIKSGGLTNAEEKKILLDATKNALSLQAAENLLVNAGYLNKGDWIEALPAVKDQKWSCLIYQLVHEFGHLIDGLQSGNAYNRLGIAYSPTKYGTTSATEAFAEAFAYWVFQLPLAPKARQAVTLTLDSKT